MILLPFFITKFLGKSKPEDNVKAIQLQLEADRIKRQCEQIEKIKSSIKDKNRYIKEYEKDHPRIKCFCGICCPVIYGTIFYYEDGTQSIQETTIGPPVLPANNDVIFMEMGVKLRYKYENCEDCPYYHTCKSSAEILKLWEEEK